MLSDLLPSSESDSEQDADSSQRGVAEDVKVGGGKDVHEVAKTRENKELGEVISALLPSLCSCLPADVSMRVRLSIASSLHVGWLCTVAEAECTPRRKATVSTKDRIQKDFCFAEASSESRCGGDRVSLA